MKQKITHLLYSIRFLLRSTLPFAFRCVLLLIIRVCRNVPTVPLIGVNSLYIVYLLIFG